MLSDAYLRKNRRVVIAWGENQCAPCPLEIIKDNGKRLKPNPKDWMSNPNIVHRGVGGSGETRTFAENTGSSALVLFNPAKPPGPDGPRDAWVALGYELVHACHVVTGTVARKLEGNTDSDSGLSEEEMRTIGTRGYGAQVPSEYWLRKVAGIVERVTYSGDDFANTTCTLTNV